MIGIVALVDLVDRRVWTPRSTDAVVAAAGLLRLPEVMRRFEPPAVVIAIADPAQTSPLERCRAWLASARHVLLVYDLRAGSESAVDAQFETHQWREDADLVAILARARELDDGNDPQDTLPRSTDRQLESGPWIELVEEARLDAVAQQLDELPLAAASIALQPWRPKLVGSDACHPVRWEGHRMQVFWHLRDAYIDSMAHDWPAGPAKKLYGYSNNYPIQVCMTPACDAFLARFTYDITFSTHVPVRWQRAGDFHVTAFDRDLHRAAFFIRDTEYDHVEVEDEDARSGPPAMVLGPGLNALALDLEVWKVTRPPGHDAQAHGEFAKVGGPNAGYAVFDFDHHLVRRATGRLLGGWYRHATTEDDGTLFREDLVTAERTVIGPADHRRCVDSSAEEVARDAILAGRLAEATRIRDANDTVADEAIGILALPGTRNVLYATATHIRVI